MYKRHFGKALKEETLNGIINELSDHTLSTTGDKVGTHEYFKYKISFISESSLDLIFLFVTGLTDSETSITLSSHVRAETDLIRELVEKRVYSGSLLESVGVRKGKKRRSRKPNE